ncbi:ester cyclase [Tianweitania populi]|uniref:Ester cyclase n=1 Tax=Tianweitania populi TaxID=1607949 RepID=A0A8J3GM00_9HYPH|nr:ester cyclase [Tianweitania populi]GHD20064.1 ester cyclase [Tianweitania populi]
MTPDQLRTIYEAYIDCLNRQDWPQLEAFVAGNVHYNGGLIGLSGYQQMSEKDHRDIPDLSFNIQMLVAEGSTIAARLRFNCTPRAEFLGLPVNGQRVSFCENVFYRFEAGKIHEVWSVIDKAAIEAQLGG